MFNPISMLIQNESMLYKPEDLILVLDRFVLPKYAQSLATNNPGLTKLQCMGILKSFHDAGKFHLSLKPAEVNSAVNAFLEERLWVEKETLTEIELLPNQRPEAWMSKPTLFRVLFQAFPSFIFETFSVAYGLIRATSLYTFYSFRAPRTFKIPKSPMERKPASLSLIKKDS